MSVNIGTTSLDKLPTTNEINETPNNIVQQPNINSNNLQLSNNQLSNNQLSNNQLNNNELDINRFVNDIQKASSSGVLNLPSRDIPQNPNNITSDSIIVDNYEKLNYDLRGGSQVISYKDGYLALNHITYLYKSKAGRKDGTYRHQFTYWDKDWNVIKRSPIFDFMGAKIEFSCGLIKYEDNYLITFGFQDNSSYILKVPEKVLEDFINVK